MIQKNWQELIKPSKVEFTSSGTKKVTLVAEPLERGFGLTLGNALRRVLLSSLRGAAVTAVQIDGVLHEFSSIPGVREDVTDIVLNIKEIAIRMEGDEAKRMVVRKQGPGVVTAGDIQTVGDIEILNPGLVICTLDEAAEIRMEFTVNNGKGYVPAERNRSEDAPIGLIPVDSLYFQADATEKMFSAKGIALDSVVEIQVDDETLAERIAGRFSCAKCGAGYHDAFHKPAVDGVCDNCGSTEFKRRPDDNRETVERRLRAYYKETAPLIGYYYAKGLLSSVDGMADMDTVTASIEDVLAKI